VKDANVGIKKHFLVVDDSELNLRVVEMLLNTLGISADYVSGADRAFTALSERDYDLMLIDYLMPGINGIEAVKIIRKMAGQKRRDYFAKLPIIILTAEEDKELVSEMIKSGANDVLSKPLKPEDLKRVLAKWSPRVHGIDDDSLENILENDPDGFAELVRVFCTDIPDKRKRIEDALAQDDYGAYTVEVHRIKGECKIISATALAEAAKMLELTGKALTGAVPNGKSDDANKKVIVRDTPKVLNALERMCPELLAVADSIAPVEDNAASDTSDDEVSENIARAELEKLMRYTDHALESLNEGDTALTAEWLGEIKEQIVKLLR